MKRLSLELPEHFNFSTNFNVRITDLNYGDHVGNDSVLSLLHEGRMRFLNHYGFSEKDAGGPGLIMLDAQLVYKRQLGYPEAITIEVAAIDPSKSGFTLAYQIRKGDGGEIAVQARTNMSFFDYDRGRPARMPEAFSVALQE